MKKILYISALILGTTTGLFAQEGFGTSSPDPSSVVDMVANDKGVLLPRVALTEITDATTVPSPADYLTVMNTATAGTGTDAVSPGYYYWLNNQWNAVSASSQEPWNIQATADDATTNTQDIYQQGKVAIGFDENDAVSTRQLEVKGDFFTEGLETNGFYSGIISNEAVSGTSMNVIYTSDYSFKNGIQDASANMTRLSTLATLEHGVSGQVLVPNGTAGMDVGFSDQNGKPGIRFSSVYDPAGPDMEEYSIHGNNGFLEMKTRHMGNEAKSIHIDATEGISFHNGNQETYRFPQIRGNANQVLTTNGDTGNSVAQLSWKDVSEVITIDQPWNIQATADDATTNTQDIYQQGKVAIGFDENDDVSDFQLEVKGEFKTETEHNGYFSGYHTGFMYDYDIPYTMTYTADYSPDDFLDMFLSSYNGSFSYETLEGPATFINNEGRQSSWSLVAKDDAHGFQIFGLGPEGESNSIRVHGYETGIFLEHKRPGEHQSRIDIIAGQGIQFDYGLPGGNYTFPAENGDQGQVLTTDGGAANAQLSWENIGDLVKAAMPKFFYMPAIIFDTSVQGTELTRDLHAEYEAQFSGTGNPNLVSSAGANSGIPTLPANELEYHITYYDPDVFANLSIDANGVLTYDIIGTATEASYMNIVFVIKD